MDEVGQPQDGADDEANPRGPQVDEGAPLPAGTFFGSQIAPTNAAIRMTAATETTTATKSQAPMDMMNSSY